MPNLLVPHYLLRLSRTEAPSLHRHYPASAVLRASPPPLGARPHRHRRPVGRPRPRPGASRVACAFLVYVLSPLPRHSHWRHCFAHPSSDVSLPRKGRRIGLCVVFFEACSAFTRVTARTLALPPMRGTPTRRLQTFRHLHACSGCFRLERLPGGACTRWKAPPFHGAHPSATPALSNAFPASGRLRGGFAASLISTPRASHRLPPARHECSGSGAA